MGKVFPSKESLDAAIAKLNPDDLYVAGPDLYRVAKELYFFLDGQPGWVALTAQLGMAIAKAEGKL